MAEIHITLIKKVAEMADMYGILHEGNYIKLQIKIRFDELRKDGLTVEECEIKLSEEFNKSIERIHRIIYEKN